MAQVQRVIRATGVSATSLDLHSKEATRWPTFKFPTPDQVDVPILAFCCINPLGACLHIKAWLLQSFDSRLYGSPDFVRIERQDLEGMAPKTEGKLIFLEGAATLDSGGGGDRKDSGVGISASAAGAQIGIIGIFLPHDPKIRWYYAALPYKELISRLENIKYISLKKVWKPGTRNHRRVYTFVRENFTRSVHIPHAPDFLNAMSITDYAPSIRDPDTALDRLLQLDSVQHQNCQDVSDDRYLLDLAPAEREIASVIQVHCAEYLLIKRTFFKEFYMEVYRSDVKKDKRVRTDHAHQVWLEEVYGWKSTKSKRLVAAWKELGMLNENKFLPWARQGGMLCETEFWEDENVEGAGTEEEHEVKRSSEEPEL